MRREIRLCHLINIAGARHYDGFRLAPFISEGDHLRLLPEPGNPVDPQAIEVLWEAPGGKVGGKLGYIPKPLNHIMTGLQPILQGRWEWEARACGPACVLDLYLIQTQDDPWREALLNFLSDATQDHDSVDRPDGGVRNIWTFRADAHIVEALARTAGFRNLEEALDVLEREAIQEEGNKSK